MGSPTALEDEITLHLHIPFPQVSSHASEAE